MDDEEFVRLDPPQSEAALKLITDKHDQHRLRLLYARTRGMLVDGKGANPRPFDPSRFAVAQAELADQAKVARHAEAYNSIPVGGMLTGGRILFWIGIGVGMVAFIYVRQPVLTPDDLGSHGYGLLALYTSSAAISFGAFMWMLGAIEQRLIEIREALRRPA